jgi:CRISPR/Cas system-associated exonuclease Cas4 (RecB family)
MKNAKRTRNLYSPKEIKPYKLSRSAIELYVDCPRCFYLDRKLGVGRPPGYPFNLNSAVDALLKKEFDFYRTKKEPHPLMLTNGVEAIPFTHPDLEKWRENFVGIQHHHTATNFIITGAVDDIWVNPAGELIVVDYKSTAKNDDIDSLDEDWHAGYKRQMEIYQWLLRQIGFQVSNTGYWVYANGDKSRDRFNAMLHFRMTVIAYDGSDVWVEDCIQNIKKCLDTDMIPEANQQCSYCAYRAAAKELKA